VPPQPPAVVQADRVAARIDDVLVEVEAEIHTGAPVERRLPLARGGVALSREYVEAVQELGVPDPVGFHPTVNVDRGRQRVDDGQVERGVVEDDGYPRVGGA